MSQNLQEELPQGDEVQENAGQQLGEQIAEGNIPQDEGVRNFRPRKVVYSQAERDKAIKMLDSGVPCRQVAKAIGPRCSSGTPIRWRNLKRKQDESRRLMEEMLERPEQRNNQIVQQALR